MRGGDRKGGGRRGAREELICGGERSEGRGGMEEWQERHEAESVEGRSGGERPWNAREGDGSTDIAAPATSLELEPAAAPGAAASLLHVYEGAVLPPVGVAPLAAVSVAATPAVLQLSRGADAAFPAAASPAQARSQSMRRPARLKSAAKLSRTTIRFRSTVPRAK